MAKDQLIARVGQDDLESLGEKGDPGHKHDRSGRALADGLSAAQ